MQLTIDWGDPVIPKPDVLETRPSDLDDFYLAASACDRLNLFFVLLTSLHHYLDQGKTEQAAHLCFLTAYYLFVPLTPPGSCELARHYIAQAVSLNPLDEYRELALLIQRGN